MAFTITYLAHNVVGNHREDYLSVVTDGTSSAIKTRLSWVEDVSIAQVGNASSDRQVDIYPNSATAVTVEDDPGQFFIQNCASGQTLRFLVAGR